ncbi:conserved hypothetical protein [Histoplasma capsulatum var. duboisii H88]|uniref:Uncharacterized protein n=1 Tax=Ajellomyces capsulatus (strain H88) TaxID=544711 RepID=F0UQJ5_AJEC8|nr:conserved hypothetical protein [Histoplasma capsulatum var. duboisii H88]
MGAESGTMKLKWDHATEVKLLMQIIKNAKLGKKDHEELAEYMAIKEHLFFMRKASLKAESSGSGPSTPEKGTGAKPTPEKRTPASGKLGSKKRKSAGDDDSKTLVDESPVKQVKTECLNGIKIKDLCKDA